MILQCLVADDEPIARIGMRKLVAQVPFLHLAGIAKDTTEISQLLAQHPVQLLFLDIQMPGTNGIDFLKTLPDPPKVIFTTAYPQYAIDGYDLDVLDYLLKPITLPRFLKAANRARDHFRQHPSPGAPLPPDHLFVKTNRQLVKLSFNEILYLEARLNYVILHTTRQPVITYASIKSMQETLPAGRFCKIHKSYIVAIDQISGVQGHEVIVGAHRLPLSRNHKETLLNLLGRQIPRDKKGSDPL